MKLYSYWRSSSAWRVRLALALKNIPHEVVTVHLVRGGGEQHLPEFLGRNPAAQVPVLEDAGAGGEVFRIAQSMAIIAYLEELHPEPALLPRDPRLRARTRQLAELVNSGIQPLQNLRLQQELRGAGVEPIPVCARLVSSGLRAFEATASETAGRFTVGDSPTLADVYLVPQLYASRRLGIDVEGFTLLRRIEVACAELPAFRAAQPDAQPDYEEGGRASEPAR